MFEKLLYICIVKQLNIKIMTKEEKIKEAYGVCWGNMPEKAKKDALNDFGYVNTDDFYLISNGFNFYQIETKEKTLTFSFHRPKSLQGIENNNGWIKIESEVYLPNKKGVYNVVFKNNPNFVNIVRYCNINKCFFSLLNRKITGTQATHYQPIEKPKPPIY